VRGLTFGPLGDDGLLERGDGGRRREAPGPDVGAVGQPELDLELLLDGGHLSRDGKRRLQPDAAESRGHLVPSTREKGKQGARCDGEGPDEEPIDSLPRTAGGADGIEAPRGGAGGVERRNLGRGPLPRAGARIRRPAAGGSGGGGVALAMALGPVGVGGGGSKNSTGSKSKKKE